MSQAILAALILLLLSAFTTGKVEVFMKNGATLIPDSTGNAIELILESNGAQVLRGQLGLALPNAAGTATTTCNPGDADVCYEWGDYAQLYFIAPNGPDNCGRVEWVTTYGRRVEDCFDIVPDVHWYGGAETLKQTWPIEVVARKEAPYVTGDFFQGVEYGGVLETYWLTSSGVAIQVDESTPLFMSWNTTHPNQVCFVAQDRKPYTERNEVRLQYDLCTPKAGENLKDVHMRAIRRYYSIPTALPDLDMLRYPLWSTWAQYKTAVNQSLVIEMARRMIQEGYTQNSHIEIDDNWESCYGEAEFNSAKFPDPARMTRELAELGITKTTLWTTPFINIECPSFDTAFRNGYFMKDTKGKQGITSWWQGANSGEIDFSNADAVAWWSGRLQRLLRDYNITAFKFDAGEANWFPSSHQLSAGDSDLLPNIFTTKYVEAVAAFGGMIETRVAHRNQGLPFFVRMLDKGSSWSDENGLGSMIPTLLQFGIVGYSFVLPDMIGGNAYGDIPNNELYIRWAQANVFMPAWQFSVLPWDQDPTLLRDKIVKAAVDLRIAYADEIVAAGRQTLVDGSPINRPMWWVDPTDPETYAIGDQFMLGDNILVAPVVQEGAVSRDIYLPRGTWRIDTPSGPQNYTGPQWLRNYPAPLAVLPFFRRMTA